MWLDWRNLGASLHWQFLWKWTQTFIQDFGNRTIPRFWAQIRRPFWLPPIRMENLLSGKPPSLDSQDRKEVISLCPEMCWIISLKTLLTNEKVSLILVQKWERSLLIDSKFLANWFPSYYRWLVSKYCLFHSLNFQYSKFVPTGHRTLKPFLIFSHEISGNIKCFAEVLEAGLFVPGSN